MKSVRIFNGFVIKVRKCFIEGAGNHGGLPLQNVVGNHGTQRNVVVKSVGATPRGCPRIFYAFVWVIIFCCLALGSSHTVNAQDDNAAAITIAGLDGTVEILRDEWGVPTIKASTDHDLFLGLGYAMAVDRIWQMDGSRRLALGRVAQIAGDDQIQWDIYHRTLGIESMARESVSLLDPNTLDHLQAFADGVNAYIENTEVLPFEFLLMGYEPEPWEVLDSLAISRLVAVWLAADAWEEEMYGRLIRSVGEELAAELFQPVPAIEPDYTGAAADQLEEEYEMRILIFNNRISKAGQSEEMTKIYNNIQNRLVSGWLEPLAQISHGGSLQASNIWAVDGSRTECGEPILAMDPHLNYFAPSVLYEVIITGGNYNCWGFTFPGVPFLPFGANEHLSWGASNFPADCQDMFVEKLNPDNKLQYDVDGAWVDFDVTSESIPVRNPDGELEFSIHKLYASRHGPIMRQRAEDYLAMKWTGTDPSDDVTGFMHAMQASSLEEFYEAFRDYHYPPQNLCCAEAGPDGRIAQIIIGDIPIRSGYDGRSPVDGSDSSNDWVGFIPYDDLPHRIDPPEGLVAHANNLPLGGLDDDSPPLGYSFATNNRVNRIIELLLAKDKLTPADMRAIQMDDLDRMARIFVPGLLAAWERLGGEYSDLAVYMEHIIGWDYYLSRSSIAATYYQLWLIELAEICIVDELPYGLSSYLAYQDRWMPLLEDYMNGESNLDWLKDDDQDARDRSLLNAFGNVITRLRREIGDDQSEWLWGDLNLAIFPHPSGVETLIGGGSHPWGGGRYTLRVGHYAIDSRLPFLNDFGAVFRSVVASVDGQWQIEAVLPPGEYGCTFGPHGSDQMSLWLAGEMRPVPFGAFEQELACTTRLSP